jgi:hypothetical protein
MRFTWRHSIATILVVPFGTCVTKGQPPDGDSAMITYRPHDAAIAEALLSGNDNGSLRELLTRTMANQAKVNGKPVNLQTEPCSTQGGPQLKHGIKQPPPLQKLQSRFDRACQNLSDDAAGMGGIWSRKTAEAVLIDEKVEHRYFDDGSDTTITTDGSLDTNFTSAAKPGVPDAIANIAAVIGLIDIVRPLIALAHREWTYSVLCESKYPSHKALCAVINAKSPAPIRRMQLGEFNQYIFPKANQTLLSKRCEPFRKAIKPWVNLLTQLKETKGKATGRGYAHGDKLLQYIAIIREGGSQLPSSWELLMEYKLIKSAQSYTAATGKFAEFDKSMCELVTIVEMMEKGGMKISSIEKAMNNASGRLDLLVACPLEELPTDSNDPLVQWLAILPRCRPKKSSEPEPANVFEHINALAPQPRISPNAQIVSWLINSAPSKPDSKHYAKYLQKISSPAVTPHVSAIPVSEMLRAFQDILKDHQDWYENLTVPPGDLVGKFFDELPWLQSLQHINTYELPLSIFNCNKKRPRFANLQPTIDSWRIERIEAISDFTTAITASEPAIPPGAAQAAEELWLRAMGVRAFPDVATIIRANARLKTWFMLIKQCRNLIEKKPKIFYTIWKCLKGPNGSNASWFLDFTWLTGKKLPWRGVNSARLYVKEDLLGNKLARSREANSNQVKSIKVPSLTKRNYYRSLMRSISSKAGLEEHFEECRCETPKGENPADALYDNILYEKNRPTPGSAAGKAIVETGLAALEAAMHVARGIPDKSLLPGGNRPIAQIISQCYDGFDNGGLERFCRDFEPLGVCVPVNRYGATAKQAASKMRLVSAFNNTSSQDQEVVAEQEEQML